MSYEPFLKKEKDNLKIKAFEENLAFHGLKQEGIYPVDPEFYLQFNRFYVEQLRNLDCLGICYYPGKT